MSFRKRNEVVAGAPGRNAIPQRTPVPQRGPVTQRGPVPQRGNAHLRSHNNNVPDQGMRDLKGSLNDLALKDNEDSILKSHPGIKPSPVTSQSTTSTGCTDLDTLLGHNGLPLMQSLLIEEVGTTDFNSILARLFVSQGIIYNRIEKSKEQKNTHVIVISNNQAFAKKLPGLYKGSKKDIKKEKIKEESSKISVSNLTENKTVRNKDLKIAWKYGLNDQPSGSSQPAQNQPDLDSNYNHQFDITTTLIPVPGSDELTFISPTLPLNQFLNQVMQTIKRHSAKLIRIVIPSLLHPSMYPPDFFSLSRIIPFLHGLRSLIKSNTNVVLFASIFTSIFSEHSMLLQQIEAIFDSILEINPFEQEMIQLLEKSYKNQPNKVQNGLINIIKLPIFSEKGEMCTSVAEWAFRNGRKKFEIEEWSIPVEDTEEPERPTVHKTEDLEY